MNHPLLADHPDHDLYKKFFKNGGGSIFTFEIKGGIKEAHEFIDHLEIFSLLANVADVKSLVIHPATTTHSQLNAQELQEQGIRQNTIRLSIGTEHIDDIIADLEKDLHLLKNCEKIKLKHEKGDNNMSKIYTSADQLIGKTPLMELTHIEKEHGLKAKNPGKIGIF